MTCPVIQPAFSEQKSDTTFPTSSGVPRRPIGVQPRVCQLRIRSCACSGSVFKTLSSVHPGLIAFTVMPRFATATAKITNERLHCCLCRTHADPRLQPAGAAPFSVSDCKDPSAIAHHRNCFAGANQKCLGLRIKRRVPSY